MNASYERRERPFESFHSESLSFYAHIHSHVELINVREGGMLIHIGGHQKTLTAGDMAVVFPNTVHSYQTPEHSRADLIIFSPELTGELAHQWLKYRAETPFLEQRALHPDARLAMARLSSCTMPQALVKGYLMVLSGRLFERVNLLKRPALADEDLLHRVLSYLDEHYQGAISLQALEKALGASRYQISRCFSKRIGCSLNTYLNTLRASCAADMLKNAGLSVAQAGYEAGFDSLSTFYRAFKASHGVTPKAYKAGL